MANRNLPTNRSRPLKVPCEFYDFIDDLSRQQAEATGYTPNKAATMRNIAKLKGRLVIKDGKIDWKLF